METLVVSLKAKERRVVLTHKIAIPLWYISNRIVCVHIHQNRCIRMSIAVQ